MKTQNKVYKEFSEGKVSKQDLDSLISKAEHEQAEFQRIKLRKIKIEYIQEQEESVRESAVVFEESKGIGQLLAMFNDPEKMAQKAARRTTKKITVEAAEGEQNQASESGETQKVAKKVTEEVDSDSDDIFDAIEDEINKEIPDKKTAEQLEEAVE